MSARDQIARATSGDSTAFDVDAVRRDFPILRERVHGKPLVYLDNAATTQKPSVVIEAIDRFYTSQCSNIHRGLHELSSRATEAYEDARVKLQQWIGAANRSEIVFTRGTTEAINLIARTYGDTQIGAGDEILITEMEHHSNIVPWQLLCERTGARLCVVPFDENGELCMDAFAQKLGPRTRLVSVVHTSNALGTRLPVEEIIAQAHARNVPVLLDGAQAVGHESIDVQALDCDFLAFSGHKMFGPTGIGVLYGKAERLNALPPFHGGGDMIHSVSFEKTTYKPAPERFEAGTPDIAGAIGLGAAVEYMQRVGVRAAAEHEAGLLQQATEQLKGIPGLRIIGNAKRKGALVSFVVDGIHPHDLGTVLDLEGVAVRAGHHCAQPVMDHFGLPATVRASFAMYNTREEVDALVAGIHKAIEMFR